MPMLERRAMARAPDPKPPQFSMAGKLSLLVVEDDEADAYLIGRTLADNPMVGRVVLARDGVEALEAVVRGEVTPDLALIDLHMPRMNGFDLLVAFAGRSDLKFPMVVLTSSGAPNDAIRSRLRSAVQVITKPDTVTEMYAVLAAAIEALFPNGERTTVARPGSTPAYLFMNAGGPGIRRPDAANDTGER